MKISVTHTAQLNGVKLSPVGIEEAFEIVLQHIRERDGSYFCFCNIHLMMEGYGDAEVKKVLNESTANFADGMGTAGALKILGHRFRGRVRGTDLMLRLCDYSVGNRLKIFLFGSTEANLKALRNRLNLLYPGVKIAGAISPPFRDLFPYEDAQLINEINASDPDILFVSLGAPKQEKWMAAHKGSVKAVQLGIGAAFDFIVGNVRQAPFWMQNAYLEWLYRLPQQPGKTLRRMKVVPEFLYLLARQYVREHLLNSH